MLPGPAAGWLAAAAAASAETASPVSKKRLQAKGENILIT